MSNSEIRTTLVHLRDSDDHDDSSKSMRIFASIYHRNLVDGTVSVRISEFDMKTY